MLTKVAIKNFKSLRDVQIDLERFTVFVGPNGSGKSSLLQGTHLLCEAFRSDPEMLGSVGRGNRTTGATHPIELAGEENGTWFCYRTKPITYRTPTTEPDNYRPLWEAKPAHAGTAPSEEDWQVWSDENFPFNFPLPASTLLQLDPVKLADPTIPHQGDPDVMGKDGSGVHAATANMALNRPDAWRWLQESLRVVVPSIVKLRHTPLRSDAPVSLLFDTVGATDLTASQVSEGTLLVLGLLVAMSRPYRPGLILLDDLDRGLHPRAQVGLILRLRELLAAQPDLQILASTHSPYMLDCMQPNEVRMTFLRDDGSTACAALADHPKFGQWKDEMTPGEMWSVFGEKWLVEGVSA